jgi:peroxiredoxin (alkyl hydroperoxide reductase subunit C)
VILLFYPLDFTFVCPTEITAFSDRNDEFRALGAQLLAISVDSKYTHLAWTQTERRNGGVGEVAFPLVSDLTKRIAASYGMLVEEEGVAMRGLFIIDPDGMVQHMAVNDLAFGRNPTEVLRILQAIQYTQSHPEELCPAGWQPGERTIPTDPVAARQYFADSAAS